MSPEQTNGRIPPAFRFHVGGMDCASCARTIEQGLRELPGVDEAHVNFTTELVEGRGRISADTLRARVEALGYRVIDAADAAAIGPGSPRGLRGFARFVWREREARIALALGILTLASLPLRFGFASVPYPVPLDWVVVLVAGWPIAARGLRSLIYARRITIETLMTAATAGAVAIGAAGEAVTVVLLFTLGEALEGYSAARARYSLRRLLDLKPARATRIREHDDAVGAAHRHYEDVDVAALAPGDRILVKAGERVPADGRIVVGATAIDESPITGEPVPVPRGTGDEVFAGTINGRGTIEAEVACAADDFTITQIAKLVEQAQAQRSPAEDFIDRFAAWYTPAVIGIAVLAALLPPLAFGQPFLTPAGGAPGWLYRGLTLLIVACPCALIISIPVTVVSALTRLAGLGVLVKGGAKLNALAKARVLAFDKTGTLTHGRPSITGVRSAECTHAGAGTSRCAPCDDLVAVAASVERGSSHPLAHAVLEAAAERHLEHRYATAADIESHADGGITGTLNGHEITIGHPDLFGPSPQRSALTAAERDEAGTLMLVSEDGRLRGYLRAEDRLRPEAPAVLAALKAFEPRYRFVMLTGDRRPVGKRVAAQTGNIDEVRAGLTPRQKLDAVRELENDYGAVAMVGDGINDAPALAGAELGIAMGGAGSHQAMEIADVVLMRDDLEQLPVAVRAARKTERLVRENIALSLTLKLAVLALAIPGFATLWMAVIADVGATVLVTLNGMRLLRASLETRS